MYNRIYYIFINYVLVRTIYDAKTRPPDRDFLGTFLGLQHIFSAFSYQIRQIFLF
jgi:hypothetical protein